MNACVTLLQAASSRVCTETPSHVQESDSDFERGLINSMKKRFPDSTEVLCQFHQAKAQFTNVQKKGLIPLYSIPEAKELLRCFMALGYLPSNEVQSGFLEVCQALDALVPSKIPSRFKPQLNRKQFI